MAIYDTMRHVKPDIATICIGQAASMGAFLLSAGEKGKRSILPNARTMIHQPLGGTQGQVTDMEIMTRYFLETRATLNKLLSRAYGAAVGEDRKGYRP